MFHRSVALIVVAVLMGSLATAVVGLRLWAVKVRSRKWGADDVFIVVGLVRSSCTEPGTLIESHDS
jgi:hypothetical protein